MSARRGWTRRKGARREGDEASAGIELSTFYEEALQLQDATAAYNLDSIPEKIELARMCWTPTPLVPDGSFSAANPNLTMILECVVDNSYRPRDLQHYINRRSCRIEGIMNDLARIRSQKCMPLMTARLSLAAHRYQLRSNLWRVIHYIFPGALASQPWTDDFVEFASQFRPACNYALLSGVGGAMFDNYQRRCQYKSQATVESHGITLNMTNWATFNIPAMLAPPNFNAIHNCALRFITLHATIPPPLLPLTPLHCLHCSSTAFPTIEH